MAYDPNVPNQDNPVRTASGDLAAMRENFTLLFPIVASGLHGLSTVDVPSPTNGQFLRYRTSTSLWVASGLVLNDIGDVVAPSPTSGQALTWNGINWVPATPVQTLSGLTDTTITAPVSGQVLTWDGSAWINGAAAASALDDLTDVAAPSPVSGQSLVFDGANWVPSGAFGAQSFMLVAFSGGSSYSASGAAVFDNVCPFDRVVETSGQVAWTLSSSGTIAVPSGVTHVNIYYSWELSSALGGSAGVSGAIYVNAEELPSGVDPSYGIRPMDVRRGVTAFWHGGHLEAKRVPVSGGDHIGGLLAASTPPETVSGSGNWLFVEDANKGGGGGGGGGGSAFTDPVYRWDPLMPPINPIDSGTYDDEFNTGTVGNVDAKWSKWDPGSVLTNSGETAAGYFRMSTGTDDTWMGYFQDFDAVSGDAWSVVTRVTVPAGNAGGSAGNSKRYVGIGLFNDVDSAPSTANMVFCGYLNGGPAASPATEFGCFTFSDYLDSTETQNGQSYEISDFPTYGWIRVTHSAAGRISACWSPDGVSWEDIEADVTATSALGGPVTSVGIVYLAHDFGSTVQFEFFRYVDSTNLFTPVSGAFAKIERAATISG